jgi:hypothetical protein
VNIATNEQKAMFFYNECCIYSPTGKCKKQKAQKQLFFVLFLQQIFTTSQAPFFFTTLPSALTTKMCVPLEVAGNYKNTSYSKNECL